jgi:peptide/nickel transport system substrate-binding protein
MTLSRRDLLALGGMTLAGTTLNVSAARAQAPKRGGTLVLRGWDPPLFDPMLQTAYRVQIPITFTHSRLVKHKAGPSVAPATFAIEGDLAESWSQPNETTYVFKLRRGVRWHPKPPVNGRELTSADVKYSVERFLTVKGNPMAYMLSSVDRVEAVDRYTVKFVLKEPFSWLLDVLANPMAIAIVARECVEKFGDLKKVEAAVGTGPWMLDSYRPNVGLTFVRNPNYFITGLPLHRSNRVPRRRGQRLTDGRVPLRQVRPGLGVPGQHQPDGLGADQGRAQAEAAEPPHRRVPEQCRDAHLHAN